MKVVLFGSPNKDGFTSKVLHNYLKDSDFKIYNAYDEEKIACDDCKHCDFDDGCSKSDLDQFYNDIEHCEELVIASPLYFATFSSKTLDYISRFQTYYQKKYLRKEELFQIKKITGIVTAGGAWPSMWVGVEEVIKTLGMLFDSESVEMIGQSCTDDTPSITEHKELKKGA